MFTDYQCPDCRKIEGELKQLMTSTPNLSVIIKNFPMCTDCNAKAPNLHGNACWAARAAITAGMIHGDDGFWQMHEWLFSQQGSFTDQSLPQALANMGYDAQMFTTLMQTEQPLQEVKKDVEEGYALGIFYTPMIFINGIELKGWNAPQALTRAVQAVLAANPAPAAPSADRPPTALEKYMADWRERPVQTIPESITKRAIGKANAPVTVVVFGDYQEEGTREVDGLLRLFATGPDYGMKYAFANFPVDQSCNPYTEVTKFAGGCRCSLAAEGADIMAGPDAFWKIHNWIMASKGVFTDKALEAEAQFDGLDPALLKEAMANPAAKAKVVADAAAGKTLGIQSIPMVFINGRYVPRWKLENENLLPRMIREEAGRAGKGNP
jgi:protein-disulfide isomerase